YLGYGRKFIFLDMNPYFGGLGDWSSDPIIKQVPHDWYQMPSMYGPAGLLLFSLPHLVFESFLPLAYALKALWCLVWLGLWRISHDYLKAVKHPHPFLWTVALLLNPLSVWMFLIDGHIEILIVLWLMVSLLGWERRNWETSGMALALACG